MIPTFVILEIAKYLPVQEEIKIFKMSKSLYEKSINIRQQYEKWWGLHKQNKYPFDNFRFVQYIIDREPSTSYNWELYLACIGGNIECVYLMIKMGTKDWNWGLSGACRGGHTECAQLMIKMGATNLNEGLYWSCRSRNIKCAKLMKKMGAYKCKWCYKPIYEH